VTASSPSIREAHPRDGEAIGRINIAAWETAYSHIFPPERLSARWASLDRVVEWWAERLGSQQPPDRTLVAEEQGQVVGFADIGPSRDEDADHQRTGEVNMIYVLPERWRRHIGQALMAEARRLMRADGFGDATLWVLRDNEQGRGFYEADGWRLDGAVKGGEFLESLVTEVRYRIRLL
jgi:GNAT superfamily N-acetyltransferase